MGKYCYKTTYCIDVDCLDGTDNDYKFTNYAKAKEEYDKITHVAYKRLSVVRNYSDNSTGHYERYEETETLESMTF